MTKEQELKAKLMATILSGLYFQDTIYDLENDENTIKNLNGALDNASECADAILSRCGIE